MLSSSYQNVRSSEAIVPKKRLLLVRHGKTEWNGLSRFQGKSDVPLNDEGKCQAELLAARLEAWHPDALFSSPLSRPGKPRRLLLPATPRISPVLLEELSEIGFGSWEGRSIHEIESADPESFRRWKDSPFDIPLPGADPSLPWNPCEVGLGRNPVKERGKDSGGEPWRNPRGHAGPSPGSSPPAGLENEDRQLLGHRNRCGEEENVLAFLNDDLHARMSGAEPEEAALSGLDFFSLAGTIKCVAEQRRRMSHV